MKVTVRVSVKMKVTVRVSVRMKVTVSCVRLANR